ncbi:MAG: hypothetical protein LRY66_10920 [Saccharospirillaceae bacterium]|nr:hypothetical protein [Saccharospirillaceae bacterium]MCD8531843.1 hypothetical protein [Saccharospirillaceae bacterium]
MSEIATDLNFLESKFEGAIYINCDLMKSIVNDISNEKLIACINLLLSRDDLLRVAAEKSYRHQLGFMKIVLMSDSQGNSLRVHFWDDLLDDILDDIHSHCADFRSRVLFGGFTESTYEMISGDDYNVFHYHFDVNAGCSSAINGGVASSIIKDIHKFKVGDIYHRSRSDLHRVERVKPSTLTVSSWMARHGEAIVLKDRNSCAEDCLVPVGMSVVEFSKVLKKIKDKIVGL